MKSDVEVPSELKTTQPRKQRAEVLQQLFKHVKDEAAALVELCTTQQKAKLRTELSTHAHMLQRTLDNIQRDCP